MYHLKIENVSKTYGTKKALDNVTIEFGEGITGLLGPNGAGKSTLIKTILKFLKQITGEIKINGKTLAYVPQRNSVDWDFPTTLFDVVEMGCYGRVGLFKRVNKEEKQKVLKAIDKANILAEDGLIICEHHLLEDLEDNIASFRKTDERKYNKKILTFYTK